MVQKKIYRKVEKVEKVKEGRERGGALKNLFDLFNVVVYKILLNTDYISPKSEQE
jgi:hypothetical protein